MGVEVTAGRTVGKFWRNVGVVLTGSAVAQLIPLLGAIVIARLYAPGEYGVFAVWLGAISLSSVVATGRFEIALALEADGEPRRVAMVATLATIGLTTSVLIGIFVSAAALSSWLHSYWWLWFVGVPAVALTAVAQTWQAWASADGRYRDLSVIRIAQSATITCSQIVVGLSEPSAVGLAVAHVIGVGFGVTIAAFRLPLTLEKPLTGSWQEGIVSFWSRQRRFPLLSLPADSVNSAAAQLPFLVVTSRFGSEVAGWLALTMRILGGPISLLGAAVLDVFRRHAAVSWRERGECRNDYMQTLKVLGAGSLSFVLVVAPSSEFLFAAVFGEPWRMAGTIALWMLPMFAMRFVASPLSYMFYVAGKQHVDLIWQLSLLGMTLAALTIPGQFADALRIYSIGYAVMYVIYLLLSYRYSCGMSR